MKRILLASVLGGVLVFVAFAVAGYVGLDLFLAAGLPEEWFVDHWPDTRGSAVCATFQLATILSMGTIIAVFFRVLRIRPSKTELLWAINPVTWICAYLAYLDARPFDPVGEFFGIWSTYLALFGWIVVLLLGIATNNRGQQSGTAPH